MVITDRRQGMFFGTDNYTFDFGGHGIFVKGYRIKHDQIRELHKCFDAIKSQGMYKEYFNA